MDIGRFKGGTTKVAISSVQRALVRQSKTRHGLQNKHCFIIYYDHLLTTALMDAIETSFSIRLDLCSPAVVPGWGLRSNMKTLETPRSLR